MQYFDIPGRSCSRAEHNIAVCYSLDYLNAVFTHFWVDNCDISVNRKTGVRSIHTTHLVAFQDMSDGCVKSNHKPSVQRRRKRQLILEDINIDTVLIDKNKNPPKVTVISSTEDDTYSINFTLCGHFLERTIHSIKEYQSLKVGNFKQ